ncbi:MAG: cytidylate kinase-like family protein [Treponema sp.]|nr:cytidylate kinase-like family protein [Treponema sp.]
MKKIITISREFGAGGGSIGRAVAKEFGYEYYDKAIILQAAKEFGMDVERVVKWDEKVPFMFGFGQSLFEFYNKPLDEKLFAAQKQVIRRLGEKGGCVIVGRNANSILREFDNSLHVFIGADPYWRMKRMKKEKMKDFSEQKISEHLHAVDKMRRKYCSHYTDTEFGVAEYYDLCLRSSSIGEEACIRIICDLAKN